MITMREWEIVMSLFISLALPLLFKKFLDLVLFAHLFYTFNKALLFYFFELLLV